MTDANGQIKVSVDAMLADRLQEYVNRGFAVRDALRQSLADVAAMLGLPGIEMTEYQFEMLAREVEERIVAWKQAQDRGNTIVAPGIEAEVVPDDAFHDKMKKSGLPS